jgi:hypothetical protein
MGCLKHQGADTLDPLVGFFLAGATVFNQTARQMPVTPLRYRETGRNLQSDDRQRCRCRFPQNGGSRAYADFSDR